jgi:hypothetical protein
MLTITSMQHWKLTYTRRFSHLAVGLSSMFDNDATLILATEQFHIHLQLSLTTKPSYRRGSYTSTKRSAPNHITCCAVASLVSNFSYLLCCDHLFKCGVFATEGVEGVSRFNRRRRSQLNEHIARDLRMQIAHRVLLQRACLRPSTVAPWP